MQKIKALKKEKEKEEECRKKKPNFFSARSSLVTPPHKGLSDR